MLVHLLPDSIEIIPSPFICHLPIGAKYNAESGMESIKFANNSGAKGRGVVLDLPGIQEISIKSFNYQSMMFVSYELS